MTTIDVVSSAAYWCDGCGMFLVPLAVDGYSRPGVRLEVRGVRVILCSECITAMAVALAERVEAEKDAKR